MTADVDVHCDRQQATVSVPASMDATDMSTSRPPHTNDQADFGQLLDEANASVRRHARQPIELTLPPGATAKTARQLEVLENDEASGLVDDPGITIALIAPAGADLEAFGQHVVQRLHRAGTDVNVIGSVKVAAVSELAHLPELGGGSNSRVEPLRASCVIYRDLHLSSHLPIDIEQRWLTTRTASASRGCVGVLHVASAAEWRAFTSFAPDMAKLVRHVIELGVPDTKATVDLVMATLRAMDLTVWNEADVTRLVDAAEATLPQRGCDLARLLGGQLAGHTARTGRADVEVVASQLGLRLDRNTDPIAGFVGFEEVARRLDGIAALAARPDLSDGLGAHTVFLGAAGTGKTTAARALAWRLHRAGATSRAHAHVVTRADLVGEYLGQTAPLVRAACQRARGGVLFVDEAYSLMTSPMNDHDSYGYEALAELVQQMEELRDELVVVLAGYPEPMAELIAVNPGLASRLTNVVAFRDLNGDELCNVFISTLRAKHLRIAAAAKAATQQYLHEAAAMPAFGNSRGVRSLVAQMLASWLARTGGDRTRPITLTDLPDAVTAAPVLDADVHRPRAAAQPSAGYL